MSREAIESNLSKIKDPGSAITHFIAMALAILAAGPLLMKAAREPGHFHVAALAVFIISMILLYAASATYHTLDISPKINRLLRKLDHMRWLRFYTFYNWSYGPVRDDGARQHPMLCPYAELTPEQKVERDASWELLGRIFAEL